MLFHRNSKILTMGIFGTPTLELPTKELRNPITHSIPVSTSKSFSTNPLSPPHTDCSLQPQQNFITGEDKQLAKTLKLCVYSRRKNTEIVEHLTDQQ